MSDAILGLPLHVVSEDGREYVIKPFVATVEKVNMLWEKFAKFKVLTSDQTRGDKQQFVRFIIDPTTVMLEVSDVGVMYATDLRPGHSCMGHYLFWDKKTAGRHRVILRGLKWIMKQFELQRVGMEVPLHAYAALNRIHKIGFKIEGRLRDSIVNNGRWQDMLLFSVLRQELTPEAISEGRLERSDLETGWYDLLYNEPELMKKVVRHERYDEAHADAAHATTVPDGDETDDADDESDDDADLPADREASSSREQVVAE